jgi:cellulase/cellobiase CelA1
MFLSAAAAVLVLLVVWIAARAVGPAQAGRGPSIVVPTLSPSLVAAPSPSPSASPSLSPSPSRSPSRKPAKTRKPSPSKSSATPRSGLVVTLRVGASWEQGYVATARVTNDGEAAARSWTVTVTHDGDDLTLRNTWNAAGRQSGDSFTFTGGGPLASGETASFGFQAGKDGGGDARPANCTVVGGRCSVS